MSQNMSTFFTGVRRNPPDRVARSTRRGTRPGPGTGGVATGGGVTGGVTLGGVATRVAATRGAATGGVTTRVAATRGAATAGGCSALASRNRRLQGGGAAAPLGAVGAAYVPRSTRPVTRLTGGGGPTAVYQSKATSSLRRQQLATPPPVRTTPAPRRLREIEWIMKPSKRFVQCSESSSEDMTSELQQLHKDGGTRRSRSSGSINARSPRLENPHPMPSSNRWMGEQEQLNLARTKTRASRVFCVPSQRIMHVEELKQAQLRQMQPRKMRSPNRSPVPSRSPTQSRASPTRKASARSLDGYLMHGSETVTKLQPMATPVPGLMERQLSTKASRPASPSRVELSVSPNKGQCPEEMESPSASPCDSPCPCDSTCPSPSPTPSPSPCPTKKPSPQPSSSSNSSLSTSGTECSVERVDERYRGVHGSKAIKLTSTVIRIIPDAASASRVSRKGRGQHHSRSKLRAKSHSVFRLGGLGGALQKRMSRDPAIKLAMNAPMIQSIAPPKSMPKVMVSKPVIGQSVNHVVNQLTAQLREAVKIRSLDEYKPAKRLTRDPASEARTSLTRKTSIYLLMDKAKGKATSESPSKDDWVIQPMEQAKEQLEQRVNPYMSDREPVRHNYDMYLRPGLRERAQAGRSHISLYKSEPKDQAMQRDPSSLGTQPPGRSPSRHSLIAVARTPSRNAINNNQPINAFLNPSERSFRSRARSRRTSLTRMSQPVSLNRIPPPRPPPVVPPPPQPKEQQQVVVVGAAGKIVRKAQHKVPSTMEDGIDMSYQYFVSIPLKRGRKPQVVRYLYRPMVRQLNPQQSPPGRRSSKRGKRRRAAAGDAAASGLDALAQQELESLDPALAALGGAPLPIGDPPPAQEEEPPEEPKPKEKPSVIFDPIAALNSPYKVPPLKLKSRYKSLLEELGQMPYPEDKSTRRRRSRRRPRAAGGSDKIIPPEYELQTLLGIGGGDDITRKDRGAPALPVRRAALVDYQAKATSVGTATGAPIRYHQPLLIRHALVRDDEPMIRTITYEHIEQEEREREQLEREQLEREQQLVRDQQEMEQLEQEQLEREQLELERQQKAKSVSFHPYPIFASKETTSEQSPTSSFFASSGSSINTVGASDSPSSKAKSRKRKGKGKNLGKNLGKGHGKGKGRK